MNPNAVLVAQNVSMTFYDGPDRHLEALGETSLALDDGEFASIIGPSGCGKSTLLRILGGLVQPSSGEVFFESTPVTAPRPRIGFVFQHPNLMPWRTTIANVELPLILRGTHEKLAREKALAVIDLVGLSGFEQALPRELSGGMQQRVALARALVHEPRALLLDEPFGSLDALTREHMNDELLRIWSVDRKTVLMVTHNIEEAIYLSDRVLVMSSRPGYITESLDIHIARPRIRENLYTPEFANLMKRLHHSLATGSA